MNLEGAGILLSILLLAFMIRRGCRLFGALLAAAALIPVFSWMPPAVTLQTFIRAVSEPVTIFLALMVAGITILGYLLDKTGMMEGLVDSLHALISDTRLLLVLLPAVVSFLTIPGGAIISAPMVKEAARGSNLSGEKLTIANLIFRHQFVLVSPLYPAIIFMSGVTGVSIFSYILFNIPVFLVGMVISLLYLFWGMLFPPVKKGDKALGPRLLKLLRNMMPFIVVVLLFIFVDIYLPLAILAGIATIIILNFNPGEAFFPALRRWLTMIWKGLSWQMVITIFAIMIYKSFIEQTTAINDGVTALMANGFPLALILVVLPYVTGLMIGNNAASLGVALPVLLPLLGASPAMGPLGLIFVSSYVGYLGSPIHLCTFLTNEFFGSNLGGVIIKFNLLGLAFIVTALGMYFIL